MGPHPDVLARLNTPLDLQRAFFDAISAQGSDLLVIDEANSATRAAWGDVPPGRPYAAFLAARGKFRTIALDFDASKVGTAASVEDAKYAAAVIRLGGIDPVVCHSGSLGGRHVIFTVQWPGISARRAQDLVDRFAGLGLVSLDKSNLRNGSTGAIRPPWSPHRSGAGMSEPEGDPHLALTKLVVGHPPEAVSILVDVIAGAGTRRPRLKPPPETAGARRSDSDDRSSTLQGLALRVRNGGGTLATLTRLLDSLEPADPVRQHLAEKGGDTHARVARAWHKAVAHYDKNPPRSAAHVPDHEVLDDWRAAEVGRLGGSAARVALALLQEAELQRRCLVGMSVRHAAERAGMSRSAAARALSDLVEWHCLEVAGTAEGTRAARYRLQPTAHWSLPTHGTVGISLYEGGVWKPTVPPVNSALALADTPGAEVWGHGGLGEPRRKVYRVLAAAALAGGEGVDVLTLAAEVGRSDSTVRRHLRALSEVGLARRTSPGLWVAEARDAMDLAFDLGVAGASSRRAAAHRLERRDHMTRVIAARFKERGIEPVMSPLGALAQQLALGEDVDVLQTT
ncbi:helix-turn-helix domain-containing protein [Nocardioides sp. AX2bis]|uniref:helix-turn-helix domain-containing protein n=1 Tax=Nocardioides sp. AX2bis TaxID=2653157 RepID=UPI003FA5939B